MTVVLPLALAWIMFCVGLTLSLKDFRRVLVAPAAVVTGLVLQMLGLPLLALCIIYFLELPSTIAIGLWLLSLSPGGATSNAISQMSGGDAALSISLTAFSSLLIPLTLPLMLPIIMADSAVSLPYEITVMKLCMVTILPVALGMVARSKASLAWSERWVLRLQRSSFAALLITVVVIVLANMQVVAQLWSIAAVASMTLCLSGMLLGYIVSRFWGEIDTMAATFAVEVGIQNAGTAIFVAAVLLQRPDLALTPLLYGILMNVPAFALIIFRQRKRESYA